MQKKNNLNLNICLNAGRRLCTASIKSPLPVNKRIFLLEYCAGKAKIPHPEFLFPVETGFL